MYRRIIICIICSTVAVFGKWVSFDGTPNPTQPTVTIIQNNAQSVILNIRVHGILVNDTTIEGITYQRISLPNETKTCDIGKAELPILNRIIQIQPTSGTVLDYTTINDTMFDDYNIFPRQISDSDSGPMPPFEKDTAFYNSDIWYPSEVVVKSNPSIFKDIRVISLYSTNFYKSITAEIKCKNGIKYNRQF